VLGGHQALPFSEDELARIIPRLHYTSRRAQDLQRTCEAYWRRQYLVQARSVEQIPSYMAIVVFCGFVSDTGSSTMRYHIPALSLNGMLPHLLVKSREFCAIIFLICSILCYFSNFVQMLCALSIDYSLSHAVGHITLPPLSQYQEGDLIQLVIDPDSTGAQAHLIPISQLAECYVPNVLPPEPFENFLIPPIDFEQDFSFLLRE
jgi:hypothetical protein